MRKAAAVKRLEDERRAKEAALAAERRRARETNDKQTERQLDEKSQAEAIARSEMLRKALEEVIVAREAAKAAEEQRLAAVKAAEEATKTAERTIAAKRAIEGADPTKVAALPKLEVPKAGFDGAWTITSISQNCMIKRVSFPLLVSGGHVSGGNKSGRVSASGGVRWTSPARTDGAPLTWTGTLRGNSGSGTYSRNDGKCGGTFTARRG